MRAKHSSPSRAGPLFIPTSHSRPSSSMAFARRSFQSHSASRITSLTDAVSPLPTHSRISAAISGVSSILIFSTLGIFTTIGKRRFERTGHAPAAVARRSRKMTGLQRLASARASLALSLILSFSASRKRSALDSSAVVGTPRTPQPSCAIEPPRSRPHITYPPGSPPTTTASKSKMMPPTSFSCCRLAPACRGTCPDRLCEEAWACACRRHHLPIPVVAAV